MVDRFDVYLVNLDAELSRDARNTRPCVVISPNEMNRNLKSVIVAPLSASAKYPTRVPVNFLSNERVVVLDQIRTVDGERLVKKIGEIDPAEQTEVLKCLAELFAE
ncbi:MAG: type II toxin-antitoxin system PemK/MazF family toxin [Acidobacteriota bacterium]